MWSPPDKNALPSPEDIKHAIDSIAALENAIEELIESTKLRIAEMRRDLEERKGWIAPIRKVPIEIMADILLCASEMDDLAPVKFRVVNRLWRNIILATPKAWSFIHMKRHYYRAIHRRNGELFDDYFTSYINTFFERSESRLLHLCLPDEERFSLKHSNLIIEKQAHRLQCFTIPADVLNDTQSSPECQKFPYLQTLNLSKEGRGGAFATSFLTVSRFPALQTLRWPRCDSTGHTISSNSFPPLQHLSLAIGRSSPSMDILRSCAATLKTLHISCEGWATTPIRITFPLLRYLNIMRRYSSADSPLVKAITPVLTSLEVTSLGSSFPVSFDADMQKVTHMRWDAFKFPPVCAHVRVLQIMVDPRYTLSRTGGDVECANKLREIAGAYPSLERIELSSEMHGHLASMQQKVEECLGEERIKPTLLWTSKLEGEFPGYVATRCGKDMPCNEW